MNPFWISAMTQGKKRKVTENMSSYKKARQYRRDKRNIRRNLKDIVLITFGVFSAAFGLKGFLLPSNFIDGGATGTALLINEITHIPLSFLLILINIPFVWMANSIVGRQFAFKTSAAIIALAIVAAFVKFPLVTHDHLLVAVFGGFFLGAGIGMSIRGGAVLDGTEVLALFVSRKAGVTIGDIVILINVIVFSAAAFFLSIESALYSMITYLSASKTLDFIIEGIEEYTAVTIISPRNQEIRQMIIDTMGRGVTVYNGRGGYGKTGYTRDVDIVYCVITRLEISRLNSEIEKIDSDAFVVMHALKDVKGGIIKKKPLHH